MCTELSQYSGIRISHHAIITRHVRDVTRHQSHCCYWRNSRIFIILQLLCFSAYNLILFNDKSNGLIIRSFKLWKRAVCLTSSLAGRAEIVLRSKSGENNRTIYIFIRCKIEEGENDAMRSRTLWYSLAPILQRSLSLLSLLGIQKTRLSSPLAVFPPAPSQPAEKFDFYPTQGIVD